MKRIAILYASREGQTAKIAAHIAELLRAHGLEPDVRDLRVDSARINLAEYSAAILAASVHTGRHQPEMIRFATDHRVPLERIPTAFLSVTLSEAGVEMTDKTPQERARFAVGVQEVIDRFIRETGWHPSHIKPVAGAIRYSQYNFLVKFIMKRIARAAGASTDTSHDYEYTDWAGLDHFIGTLADEFAFAARS